MTASPTGGWHHVEQRSQWWWIARMEMQGFKYSPQLTEVIRLNAELDPGRAALGFGNASMPYVQGGGLTTAKHGGP